MTETPQLLTEYVKTGSEPAFHELVSRYVDLVHSTALRLVNGDTHRAEDVTQTVFADLARLARTLSPNVMLGGWLHRHTCFVASNVMRGERRRQNRERQAVEMSSLEDHSEENLTTVAPVLDEAINQLGTADRQAILLRFFEQRDFQSVGAAMGSNEEAARKRVNRALEKLHLLLKNRGIVFSATALGSLLGSHAVSAAPVGMAAGIAASAVAGAAITAAAGTTTFTLLTIMNTKLKLAIVGALAVAVAVPFVIQQKALNAAREETVVLRQQVQKMEALETENKRLAALASESAPALTPTNDPSRELLQARGEINRMRTAAATPKPPGPSALSGLTANPEMMKMIRDQQKVALSDIYKILRKS